MKTNWYNKLAQGVMYNTTWRHYYFPYWAFFTAQEIFARSLISRPNVMVEDNLILC